MGILEEMTLKKVELKQIKLEKEHAANIEAIKNETEQTKLQIIKMKKELEDVNYKIWERKKLFVDYETAKKMKREAHAKLMNLQMEKDDSKIIIQKAVPQPKTEE